MLSYGVKMLGTSLGTELMGLGVLFICAIIGGIIASRFRQPAVFGLLLVGALIGPSALNLIPDEKMVHTMAEFGAILMLFIIGLEFDISKLIKMGARTLLLGLLKFAILLFMGFEIAQILGFNTQVAMFIGVILSFGGTVVIMKVLEQKSMVHRKEVPLLIGILIIEDILAVFAITFFSGVQVHSLSLIQTFEKIGLAILILIATYLFLMKFLRKAVLLIQKNNNDDAVYTYLSLGVGALLSYFAYFIGLTPTAGAFLAGNIISSLPKSKLFEKAIHPFLLTFTSLFFFSVGTNVNFAAIIGNFNVIIVLFLATIASAFASIAFGSYLFTNFSGRQAVFSALAMIPVGEFSLLIANEASAVGLGIDFISITAGIILLSTISMSLLIGRGESIYNLTANLIPSRVKEDMQLTSKYFNNLSWSMIKDKIDTRRMNLEWKAIVNNLFIIFFIISAAFFTWRYFKGFVMQFIQNVAITYTLAVLLAISVFYILSRIIKNLSRLLKDFYRFFVKISPGEVEFDRKIFRNIVLLCIFFIILVITPNFFVFFSLNPVYNFIVIAIFAGTLIYVYNASKLIREIVHKHSSTFNKFSKKYKSAMKNKIEMRNKKDE